MSGIDIAHQVRIWREKAKSSEGLNRDEMREAVSMLRADRKMSVMVGEIKKAKMVKEPKVKEIDGLLANFAKQMSETPKP